MRYVITRRLMGDHPELAISSAEFESFKDAKRGLIVLMSIEEKFAMLVANYREFETELLARSVNSLVYQQHDYGSMHDGRVELSRRIANLLSSARMFIDQVQHDWSSLGIASAPVAALLAKEYDARLGYRAMEALRNFAQHRSVPVHIIEHPFGTDLSDTTRKRVRVIPRVSVRKLAEDPKFKKGILAELQALGDSCDLRVLIRDYVDGLASVQRTLRAEWATTALLWESILDELLARWRREVGPHIGALGVVRLDDAGDELEAEDLFDDFVQRRRDFGRTLAHAPPLSVVFVSGAISLNFGGQGSFRTALSWGAWRRPP
jgi:hypothetical protein